MKRYQVDRLPSEMTSSTGRKEEWYVVRSWEGDYCNHQEYLHKDGVWRHSCTTGDDLRNPIFSGYFPTKEEAQIALDKALMNEVDTGSGGRDV